MPFIIHPTGNQFVRALLAHCHTQALDVQFFTTIASRADAGCCSYLPGRWAKEWLRREYPLPSSQIKTRPWREGVRLLASRFGISNLTRHESGWASADAVYQDLDRHVARRLSSTAQPTSLKVVHAYEDGAAHSFSAARQLGIHCSYELPIAYWETARQLMHEEALRWPEWEPTLQATQDSETKCARKTQEANLADVIVCPSRFVQRSLPPLLQAKSIIAEFGSPPITTETISLRRADRPLRVLFAGTLTQRKGLADLFAAMKLLARKDVELIVFGSLVAPMKFYRSQYDGFRYETPRPHLDVLRLMDECDLLALPSILEGRALVQQEALSRGLPLLVTPNAGGEDLVDAGKTGFLVPIRSPEALAERINWFAEHRQELETMRDYCRHKAIASSWKNYAEKIVASWPI